MGWMLNAMCLQIALHRITVDVCVSTHTLSCDRNPQTQMTTILHWSIQGSWRAACSNESKSKDIPKILYNTWYYTVWPNCKGFSDTHHIWSNKHRPSSVLKTKPDNHWITLEQFVKNHLAITQWPTDGPLAATACRQQPVGNSWLCTVCPPGSCSLIHSRLDIFFTNVCNEKTTVNTFQNGSLNLYWDQENFQSHNPTLPIVSVQSCDDQTKETST